MKIGIIQPNYLPWRGYFDFIQSVDKFVYFDDVQYTKRDWRNRNKIKSANGDIWLTVPVIGHRDQLLKDTRIDNSQRWQSKHLRALDRSYGKSTYYDTFRGELSELICRSEDFLTTLNVHLIEFVMGELDIHTPTVLSSTLNVNGADPTDRLVSMCESLGATGYLSGPAARDYIDTEMFAEREISLEFKDYHYPNYPQIWDGFSGNVSVLDLMANCGPKAKEFLMGSE